MKTNNIKIKPQWEKSKDEIWNEVFADMVDSETTETLTPKVKRLPIWRYVAAAVAAILVIGTSFTYLYTTTEVAERGTHLAVVLPDGSKVNLNAESELSYKPYWWHVSRGVNLKGEAFFEVESGSKFDVQSEGNQVRVLGTSFNILARANIYKVSCLTGKVEVTANSEKTILTPNMEVILNNGNFKVENTTTINEAISWTQNKFSFVGVPLADVVKEIERQYDIDVVANSKLDYLYTGNFSKSKKPEEVLEIIGKPFGITFKVKN